MAKGLTRTRIIEAALEVLDDGGAEAVTVRAVAQRLGVKAPALYWHVTGKQELLDEMGTEIQRRVQRRIAPVGEESWSEALTTYARALRSEYLLHRDGARTFSGTRLTDPEVLRAQEPWLRHWSGAEVTVADLVTAVELVTAFVVGFVIEEQERSQSAVDDPERYSASVRDAALGDEVPLVREAGHVRQSFDVAFDRQLGIVMAGLAATFGE